MDINTEYHGSKSFSEDEQQVTESSRKRTQEKIIFSHLFRNVATNSMVSISTGIPRASICKIKRHLEKQGKLFEVKKATCEVSKHKAYFLTTNPDFVNQKTSNAHG